MEPLSDALHQLTAAPPPTTIDVDRIIATEQRRGRQRYWAAGTVAAAVVATAVVAGGSVVGTNALVGRYTGDNVHALPGATSKVSIDGPVNILLVGIDSRNNPGELVRSDTIMIVHIPASHDRAYLVSIPRDTSVEIPPFKRTGYSGGREKIDAAYAFGSQGKGGVQGGLTLLADTIKQMSGISFDAAAVVDFSAFKNVVAVLGGVDMCIDEKTTSLHIGFDKNGNFAAPFRMNGGAPTPVPGVTPYVYEPGCRSLKPWEALDYIRQRVFIPDGDYGRQRHEQQFLAAIAKQVMSAGVLTNPAKLDSVIRAAGSGLTVDAGRASPIDWMLTLKSAGHDIVMIKTNAGHFQPAMVDGEVREKLSPDSVRLLQAVRDDTLADFVNQHPDWVVKDR